MENFGNGQTTTAASPQATNKTKGRRTKRMSHAQVIAEFLDNASPYEADALRIARALGRKKSDTDTLQDEDKLCLNLYLDFGLSADETDANSITTHRASRAIKLAKALTKVADAATQAAASSAVYMFAVRCTDWRKTMRKAAQ